ncbi:hypothetical protein BDP27DRAFT_828794 [Rhodocollybia butyracea]|uniref:Uncharacterized protein n=1 Tax=Rhodocollybia butyracea TaxID=206335 RepID=A0A9P5PS20_9AGAR|nr:hypothetical protein BDP27DRAFT_828794 [Rhodocollybia butyracea]
MDALKVSPACILTGIWINILFYSLEVLVGSFYFFTVPGKKAKIVMGVALIVDAAGTFATAKLAWLIILNRRLFPLSMPTTTII